jgi:hypothetical protein
MITWDENIQDCQDLASDTNTATLAFLKRWMNKGYKKVLGHFGRPESEDTRTASTVANQQAYLLPPNFLKYTTITVAVGSTIYEVIECESQYHWDILNRSTQTGDIPQQFFIRPRFGAGGHELLLWPTPSSSGNTIKIVYQATDKDLTQVKYTTGTITVTNGSATVTGSGTSWTSAMVGRYFQNTDSSGNTDGMFYRIAAVGNGTSLTLENNYTGQTASGLTYQIVEMFGLPEDMQTLPESYALWHYFKWKKDKVMAETYREEFWAELRDAETRYGNKGTSGILSKTPSSNFGGVRPLNFPRSIGS